MTDDNTQDTPAQLTTLWELSDEGKAEWWPEQLNYDEGNMISGWWYTYDNITSASMEEHHALDIVRGSAERWLSDRDWECVRIAQGKGHNYWCKKDWSLKGLTSLADAIRAETNRRRT